MVQGRYAAVVRCCGFFPVALVAAVLVGSTVRSVLIKKESVQYFAAALVRTLNKTKLAFLVDVLHEFFKREVGLSTLLRAVERGRLVGFLDEWVQGFHFLGWHLTFGAATIVFLETRLTDRMLAPLAFDWKQRHHMAVGTREHRKDDV